MTDRQDNGAPPHDAAFAKYAEAGAYHWREIGRHPVRHQAFTAERYRRTLAAAGDLAGQRVLDYGCGDGALLGMISRLVGAEGEAHGLDVNGEAVRLAAAMLARRGLAATLHRRPEELPAAHFDIVLCAEVIEHAHDPQQLLDHIRCALTPGGRAVITTPVRLTEQPEDPNHVQEWFPGEFRELLVAAPLTLLEHRQIIPAAAAEVYFWRPPFLLRFPFFRLLANLLSIAGVNALSWFAVRPRLFMTQLAVLERPTDDEG